MFIRKITPLNYSLQEDSCRTSGPKQNYQQLIDSCRLDRSSSSLTCLHLKQQNCWFISKTAPQVPFAGPLVKISMSKVQFLTGELLLHDVTLFSSLVSCLRLLAVEEDAQHATKKWSSLTLKFLTYEKVRNSRHLLLTTLFGFVMAELMVYITLRLNDLFVLNQYL